jgi:hypothetical protein
MSSRSRLLVPLLVSAVTLGSAGVASATTDPLGTHEGPALVGTSQVASPDCSIGAQFGGGFATNLGSGWTSLAARSGPCTAAVAGGAWGVGSRFDVSRETHGQFICRGRIQFGYGTDVWFKTSRGWAWSGGTADARWHDPNHGC